MCDSPHPLAPLEEDEYVLDTPLVHDFVGSVRARIDEAESPARACELIQPLFHPRIVGEGAEGVGELNAEIDREGVALLGPLQGDHRDLLAPLQ